MFILAKQQESEDVYMVTDFADSFVFMHSRNTHIDIPTDYQCVRMWFDCPIKIEPPASTVICHNPNDFRME